MNKKNNKVIYTGVKMLKRSGNLLNGEITITGIKNMEKGISKISIDLSKLNELEMKENVNSITLK